MIRLVSHNVFWFQGHPFQGDQPGAPVPGILNECVQLYRELKADALCLQEIQSAAVAMQIAGAMESAVEYVAGGEFLQYGGVVLCAAAELAESQVAPARIWQRVTLATSAGPLTLVNIHAPSDRQLGTAASEERRQTEFRAGLKDQPPADVLLGDFNERPGRAISILLAQAGYIDCAAHTGNGDRATSIGGKRSDWIWIHPRWAGKLKSYDAVKPMDFLSATPDKQFISDHLPIWIDLDLDWA